MEFLNLIGLDWSALEDALRLIVAMIVGALVGWERERGNRPAGLRTHMLVCMGSCLVMAEEMGAYILTDKATFLTFQANNGKI